MFCPNCGKEVTDVNAVFCQHCGGRLRTNSIIKKNEETQVIVSVQPKNPGIALALTIVFGGFGLLYSSVKYAIILLIVDVIAFIGSVLMPMIDRDFMSVSPLLMMIVILSWPASIILAWHSVKTYNKGLKRGKN